MKDLLVTVTYCLLLVFQNGCTQSEGSNKKVVLQNMFQGNLNLGQKVSDNDIRYQLFRTTLIEGISTVQLEIKAEGFTPQLVMIDSKNDIISQRLGNGRLRSSNVSTDDIYILLTSSSGKTGRYTLRASLIQKKTCKNKLLTRSDSFKMNPDTWADYKNKATHKCDITGLSYPINLVSTKNNILTGMLSKESSQKVETDNKFLEIFTFETNESSSFINVNLTSNLFDTWLMVVTPSGDVWTDDDSGEEKNSRLLIESKQKGQWYVIATTYKENQTGSFQIEVTEIEEELFPIILSPIDNTVQVSTMANLFLLNEKRRQERERLERERLEERESRIMSSPRNSYDRDSESIIETLRSLMRQMNTIESRNEENFSYLTNFVKTQMQLQEERSSNLERELNSLKIKLAATSTNELNVNKAAQPKFPWPPPQASALSVLPRSLFVKNNGNSLPKLNQINIQLSEALNQCKYQEKRYYAVPNGFALVTKLEQIDNEGRPKEPRWCTKISALKDFTLSSYITALMTAPYGYFRVIAFVVTSNPFSTTGTPLTRKQADKWLINGMNLLPPSISEATFTRNHQITTLIYEFEKKGQKGSVNYLVPGKLQGETHIKGSGLLSALRGQN